MPASIDRIYRHSSDIGAHPPRPNTLRISDWKANRRLLPSRADILFGVVLNTQFLVLNTATLPKTREGKTETKRKPTEIKRAASSATACCDYRATDTKDTRQDTRRGRRQPSSHHKPNAKRDEKKKI